MNAAYYYTDGTEQFGPFAVEQLRQEPINPQTMVWRTGLATWQKAGELNEFGNWFAPVPPPVPPPIPAGPPPLETRRADPATQPPILTVPQPVNSQPAMFQAPFSFRGRIRRLEYGLSLLGVTVLNYLIFSAMADAPETGAVLYMLSFIPVSLFALAQATKRCHDLNKSGWYQLIPFYVFILLFEEGDFQTNSYGLNPKIIN